MKLLFNYRKSRGFTIIEMIVSVSIIALISTLFIANYRHSNQQTDLTMAAQKLVADFHAAQNNTLGLINYNDMLPSGGWSIHFDTSKNNYVLYAELHATGTNGYMDYDQSLEGVTAHGARIVNLPSNVRIVSLYDENSNSVVSPMADVNFLPPDPQTTIHLGSAPIKLLSIVLKNSANDLCRTVQINFLGLAEVLDRKTCP